MLTRSGKNKGKKLQKEVQKLLLEKTLKFGLVEGDIENTIMGESGKDIKLSPAAQKIIPFDIECKNTESFNRNNSIEQAESNSKEGRIPIVVFRKNRSKTYTIVPRNEILEYMNNNILSENFMLYNVLTKNFNVWNKIEELQKTLKPFIISFHKNSKIYFIIEFETLINLLYEK